MKRNIGSTDKSLRMVVGFAIIAAGIYYSNILWITGIPIAATGVIGWCPVYAALGISTHEK